MKMAVLIIAIIAVIVLVLACCKVSGEADEQYSNINWDYVKYFNERHEEEY